MSVIKIPISELDIVVACDPAISERIKACRTAVVCWGLSPLGKYFMLDCWAKREGDPAIIIDNILNMANDWMPRAIGIEMIGYQKALQPYMLRAMKERGKYYPIIELKPDRNTKTVEKKNQRILSMVPFFRTGQVYIPAGMFDFIEEFENFPNSVTVDILDASSYAVRMLTPKEDRIHSSLDIELLKLQKEDPASALYWRKFHEREGTLEDAEVVQLEEVKEGENEFIDEMEAYYA